MMVNLRTQYAAYHWLPTFAFSKRRLTLSHQDEAEPEEEFSDYAEDL